MEQPPVILILAVALFTNIVAAQSSAPQEATTSAAATAASPSATPAAGGPSTANATPARAHFVPVLVSATDAGGSPATGLSKEQFSITDAMRPAEPLRLFKAEDVPLHLAVVLLADPGTFSQQQAAAIDLIKKVVRPNVDEAFVVTARGKKPWPSPRLEWKRVPEELSKFVSDLDRSAGLDDAFTFDLDTSETALDRNRGRNTTQIYSTGGVSVFDAVFAMMNSDPRPARRVMVIFRQAWPHSPGFGRQVNTIVENKLTQVIGAAQELHVATFVIGLDDPKFNGITDNNIGKIYISLSGGGAAGDGGGGSGGRAYDAALEKSKLSAYEAGKTNVQRLATETGGTTYWSMKKNYTDAVSGIANFLAGQYIVTFTPSDTASPVHPLKITTTSNAKVLAQTSFFYSPAK